MSRVEIQQLIVGLGATAEILGFLYKNLVKKGFTQKQALQLTQTYMAILYTPKGD